jgi:hypothetical protein
MGACGKSVDHPAGSGHHDDAINSAAGALVQAKPCAFVALAPISITKTNGFSFARRY